MGFGLSSLGSAIGGFMQSGTGQALTSAVVNNYFNKKAASKQFAYTKSLIDYENEYNTPKNQMARLEEAGLNPNLVYNNGSATIASATGSAPQVRPAQLDLLSAYNLEAQNDLLQQQKRLTESNVALTKENAQIAELRKSEARAKSTMALYNADYAQQEHEAWRTTHKIPESYYRNQGTPQFLLRLLDNIAGM